ncbi:MAG: PadR family transcriptional regulator [Bryobacteraceae bacterium]|nr:PadR family transcriptional regulator [Bryobacteraceae bacterium]
MARTDNLQGALEILVLKILSRRGALHGYGLAAHIETLSEEVLRVEEGSLYPALHRMEEAGLIRAKQGVSESGRKVRFYDITAAGKKRLGLEEERWSAIAAAVAQVLRQA